MPQSHEKNIKKPYINLALERTDGWLEPWWERTRCQGSSPRLIGVVAI